MSPRRSIAVSAVAADEVPSLRRRFERDHHVLIRGLLPGPLVERVRREMDPAEFEVFEHAGIKTELRLTASRALALLAFVVNDPELFEVVRAITGCDRIGAFKGRVYRMLPGGEHEDSWHNDVVEGRMVAMSVNLSDATYSGGVLEIREHESKRVIHRVANTGFGDAVIFRIDRALQHRVCAVDGDAPKTAYAGWFVSGPDAELLHPRDYLTTSAVG